MEKSLSRTNKRTNRHLTDLTFNVKIRWILGKEVSKVNKYRSFTMRIDLDMLEWFREYAKRQRSSMSEVIYEQLTRLRKQDQREAKAA